MNTPVTPKSLKLPFGEQQPTAELVRGLRPYYQTGYGTAYLADSLEAMKAIPDASVNLVFTSPPYALHFKKHMETSRSPNTSSGSSHSPAKFGAF